MEIKEILMFLRTEGIPFSFIGDDNIEVSGFSSLNHYRQRSFTWVKKKDNIPNHFDSNSVPLVFSGEDLSDLFPNTIITAESKNAFFSTIEHFYSEKREESPIGISTYIGPDVKIGKNVRIGHNCTMDGNITIGDNTRIYNNVTIIHKVNIGESCEIQSGVNLGHDGFAYVEDENHNKKMVKHYGGIIIGDNVYIGGNTCIERGTIDDTIIEDGVKIDMQCLIGHNSVIRKNAAIVGGSVLLGSVKLDENSYIASALIRNQGHVYKNAMVGMGSVVVKDVREGSTVMGVPAKEK